MTDRDDEQWAARLEVLLERPRLAERIRELEAVLRALVTTVPTYTDAYGSDPLRCIYCAGEEQREGGRSDFWRFVHKEDCPWARARALLSPPT